MIESGPIFVEPDFFPEKEFFVLEGICLTCLDIIVSESARKPTMEDFSLKTLIISEGLDFIGRIDAAIDRHQLKMDLAPSVMLNHGPIKAVELYWNGLPIARF